MAKVTLDKETFKALASETRLDLLRSLDARRKTGSELAREMELNKATVHEHLQLLSGVGLIRKVDEGRKWIYYELTWQGQKLLHPETGATFAVLLGFATAALGGGFAFLGQALGLWWQGRSDEAAADDQRVESLAASPPEADMTTEPMGSSFFADGGWFALALLASALVFIGLAVWLRKRR